jgi:hypothetical protein
VALLLERVGSGKKEAAVAPLSKESRRFLEMWRQSPPGELKVLFNSCSRDEIDPFRMLTGKKLLEDSGFEIHYAVDTPKNGLVKSYFSSQEAKSLSDFAIYVLPGSRIRDEAAAKEIASYVKNGGSVLLSGTANFGYFGWMSNGYQRKKLFDVFGLRCSDANFTDAERNFFSPLFCEFSEIASGHPVTNGVGSVQLAGASVIQPGAEGQEVLIRSNASSSPQKAPFLIAMEFGKGRVVAMGDAQWMEPEWLCKAGNAQLMLNIFNWLARRDCQPLPKDKLAAAVNCSFGD